MSTRADVVAELTAPGAPFALTTATVRGRELRVHAGPPWTLRDVLESTRAHGDRPFTVYDGERVTFAEHLGLVAGLARVYREEWGLRPGDRIAVCARQYPQWAPVCWAAWVSGLVVVPLNAWWTASELAFAVRDAAPRVVVADDERADRFAGLDTRVVTMRDPAWDALVARLDRDAELPEVAVDPDDDAFVLYTSGTTGRPKGAVGTHRNLCADVHNRALATAVSARVTGTAPPERPGVLLAFPFFHVAGMCALVAATASGTTVATLRRWDPDAARALIARERLTSAAGVPTVMRDLVDQAARHPDDLASLTGIGMGGAPIPPALARAVSSAGKAPSNGYGLTETTSMIVSAVGADYTATPDAVGRPVPSADVRVVDPDTCADRGEGEVGEVWFRGPNVVRGYLHAPEATAAAFVDGWFRTGDLGRVDDGVLRIVDRLKDVVVRGGENVYCAEVEAVLAEHPDVVDAAVVGAPHPTLGEEVAAVVVVRPGATLDAAAVREHVGERLAGFKVPARVELRDGPLPRNATGKVLKADLRSALG